MKMKKLFLIVLIKHLSQSASGPPNCCFRHCVVGECDLIVDEEERKLERVHKLSHTLDVQRPLRPFLHLEISFFIIIV